MDGHLREDSLKTQNGDKERMVISTNFGESVIGITEGELVGNRLSIDEALKIAMDGNCFSDTSYLKTFLMGVKYCKNAKNIGREVDKIDDYDWAIDSIRGRNILEIGAGEIPFNRQIECGEYIGLDPFTGGIGGILKVDGLNFLRGCQDNFASIVSFGVIDDDIILSRRYLEELAEEIRRVSDGHALLIGADVIKYFGKEGLVVEFQNLGGLYNFNKETHTK